MPCKYFSLTSNSGQFKVMVLTIYTIYDKFALNLILSSQLKTFMDECTVSQDPISKSTIFRIQF